MRTEDAMLAIERSEKLAIAREGLQEIFGGLTPLQEQVLFRDIAVALSEDHSPIVDVIDPLFRDAYGHGIVIVPSGTIITRRHVIEMVKVGIETVLVYAFACERES